MKKEVRELIERHQSHGKGTEKHFYMVLDEKGKKHAYEHLDMALHCFEEYGVKAYMYSKMDLVPKYCLFATK